MYVLGNKWVNKHLDYHRLQNQYRIDVRIWIEIMPVPSQYFIRPKTWSILWNYLREVGFWAVVNRIRSRLAENGRNDKYLSIGMGVVREQAEDGYLQIGEQVIFIAYNHPKCVSSLCLEEALVFRWSGDSQNQGTEIKWFAAPKNWSCPQILTELAGWSFFSEQLLPDISGTQTELISLLNQFIPKEADINLPVPSLKLPIQERTENELLPNKNRDSVKRAVLFGLGNYAKVAIFPYLNKRIDIACIHEIDPTQIGPVVSDKKIYDTSHTARADELYDAYFIAGYHHTHIPIAISALSQGAYAVIEKPLATTIEQLKSFESIIAHQDKSRFFVCFNKRYSLYNQWIDTDFNKQSNNPISMHCLVYEEPLPEKHWYKWPSSGSYIISCGCHWIDHFLMVNDYVFVHKQWAQKARNGDISLMIELENGAVFSMVITETGSSRLGLRDYVEIKQGNVFARLINGSRYESENQHRILRQQSINRLDGHARMYRNISDRIISGQSGDSIKSLYSSKLVIELESILR